MYKRQSNENSTDDGEDESNSPLSVSNEPEAKVTRVSPKKSLPDCVSGFAGNEPSPSTERRYPKSKQVGDETYHYTSYVKESSHPSGGNYSDYRSPLKSQKKLSPCSPPTHSEAPGKDTPPPIPSRSVKTHAPAVHQRFAEDPRPCLTPTLSPDNPENPKNKPPPLLAKSPIWASSKTHGHSSQKKTLPTVQPQLYSDIPLAQSAELNPPSLPPRAPRRLFPGPFLPPAQNIAAGGSELPHSGISQISGQSVRPKVQKTPEGSMESRSGTSIHQTERDGSDGRESNFCETSGGATSLTVQTQIESNVQYGNVCTDEFASHSSGASTSCSSMVGESNLPSLQSLESSPNLSSENIRMAGDVSLNQDISKPFGACGLNNCCSTGQSCDSEGNCSEKCLSCSIDDCRTHCRNHCIIHCSLHDCTSLLGTLCTSASTSPSTWV